MAEKNYNIRIERTNRKIISSYDLLCAERVNYGTAVLKNIIFQLQYFNFLNCIASCITCINDHEFTSIEVPTTTMLLFIGRKEATPRHFSPRFIHCLLLRSVSITLAPLKISFIHNAVASAVKMRPTNFCLRNALNSDSRC